jgi:hypothetical protein
MAKKLADDRKSETCARGDGRKRVSKVMDAYTFEARVPLNRAPRLLKTGARALGV